MEALMADMAKVTRAFGQTVLFAAALLAASCGREPLDPVGASAGPAGGPGSMAAGAPPDTSATLRGLWSGQLAASAPGFAFGPTEGLTLDFDDSATLVSEKWDGNRLPPRSYGPSAPDFPLQGERDVPLTTSSLFTVHVTVTAVELAPDHFHLRDHVVGTGMTPPTDYVEDVSGQLTGGTLHVTYSLVGVLLALGMNATAVGDLHSATAGP